MSGPGRPRHRDALRPGASAAEQILDAAGELFVTRGVTVTSTRAIAEAVGIRQASLYHHFATKDAILDALLATTVEPSLAFAERLVAMRRPAEHTLWALTAGDAANLLSGRWNLGRLYLLPEADAVGPFHERRCALHAVYRDLAATVVGDRDDPRCDLPVRLAETVIAHRVAEPEAVRRLDDATGLPVAAVTPADASLRVLGAAVDAGVRAAGVALVTAYRADPGTATG